MPKMTYEQVLRKLEVPVDTDKVKTCKFCGGLLHMVKINRLTNFWVHKDTASVEKCASKNTLHPGHPIIVQNIDYYKKMADVWNMVVGERNERAKDK